MDFVFSPEEEAFRQEIRAFCRAELPANWGSGAYNDREDSPPDLGPTARAFQRKLADKGWLTLAWPKEYGGLGAGPMMQLVYNEEMSALRAPGFGGMGVAMVGPTLMLHGTEQQKERFLGRSRAVRSAGARDSANPAAARTSRHCRQRPSRTATTSSSTDRRSGRPAHTARTTASCSRAPIPKRPSTRASATS